MNIYIYIYIYLLNGEIGGFNVVDISDFFLNCLIFLRNVSYVKFSLVCNRPILC